MSSLNCSGRVATPSSLTFLVQVVNDDIYGGILRSIFSKESHDESAGKRDRFTCILLHYFSLGDRWRAYLYSFYTA